MRYCNRVLSRWRRGHSPRCSARSAAHARHLLAWDRIPVDVDQQLAKTLGSQDPSSGLSPGIPSPYWSTIS
eukprot:8358254-Pyramimonas_sp.AAC.1